MHIEDAGHSRSVVQDALSIDRAEASKLLAVARSVPARRCSGDREGFEGRPRPLAILRANWSRMPLRSSASEQQSLNRNLQRAKLMHDFVATFSAASRPVSQEDIEAVGREVGLVHLRRQNCAYSSHGARTEAHHRQEYPDGIRGISCRPTSGPVRRLFRDERGPGNHRGLTASSLNTNQEQTRERKKAPETEFRKPSLQVWRLTENHFRESQSRVSTRFIAVSASRFSLPS